MFNLCKDISFSKIFNIISFLEEYILYTKKPHVLEFLNTMRIPSYACL